MRAFRTRWELRSLRRKGPAVDVTHETEVRDDQIDTVKTGAAENAVADRTSGASPESQSSTLVDAAGAADNIPVPERNAESDVLDGNEHLQPDEIRVLDIEPARSEDDLIRCRLRRLRLPPAESAISGERDVSAPWLRQPTLREAYMTLSYAWGKTAIDGSHLTHTILCDGMPLRVAVNLHSALQAVRRILSIEDSLSGDPAWIDALCINQKDIEERNSQVQKMDRIYQFSSTVIIWLGGHDTQEVHRFLPKLCSVCEDYPTDELDPEAWERRQLLGYRSPFDSADKDAMLQILSRPWFSRRWVIQEAYHKHPRNRLMCIGDSWITGDTFERALWDMRLSRKAPALERAAQQQRSVLQNLQVYSSAKCADPRDCIYALLSISRERRTLVVDYGVSTKELYFKSAC
ncbi:hypothetical protein LTR53_003988 [Teratosphaeriaceae sp. CCFEE 6253]|nr:hypothetical protein LTR53_003988 [Teratosphaeriaceae sp. CCFEE 6253]